MKKYQITLVHQEQVNGVDMHSIDVVEGDTMIEVLCQLNIVIAGLVKSVTAIKERRNAGGDDDIPF